MNKTLKISFSLKNTYRVNGVLFSLKQIPLVKRLLPATLYQVKGLKIFANILSVLWEIVSVFLGKFLYFITMVCGIGILYNGLPENEVFLHILLILTVIGSFVNTHLFNPTKDKYYAMILMKMDAREYTLVNYFYSILKVVVGFLPFTILFGMDRGVPLWFCLLLPLCIAGMKLFAAAVTLWDYEKRGFGYNENKLSKYVWCCIALLLAAAYAPPAFGFALPAVVPMVIFLACIPLGMASITRLTTFRDYYAINKELLAGLTNQMDSTAQTKLIKQANEKKISADTSISSNRKGFEYLNELFIKRHKKILWNSTKKISYVCAFLVAAVLAGVYLLPEEKTVINEIVMTWLPYFVFIMYAINRGTNFTQALFMNCDHSLLTYSFYKQPSFILRLFQMRGRAYATLRTVPSGGARHAFETYLVVRYVEGLRPGAYHYLPMEHALEFLHPVERLEDVVSDTLCGQSWAAKASVIFYWSVVPYRAEWRYGPYAYAPLLVDAGHVGENLYLACASQGLGTCGLRAFRHELCCELFGLDGEEEFIVYAAPVGTVRPEDTAQEAAFYQFVEDENL